MSARIEPRSSDWVGRVVVVAALAGLTGVVMTIIAASALLVGADTGSGSVTTVQSAPLEPGYVDYGLRIGGTTASAPLEPGYVDYGLRNTGAVESWPLEPGYVDYGLRNRQP